MWFHLSRGFPQNLCRCPRALGVWCSGTLGESPVSQHRGETVWEQTNSTHGFRFCDLITKQALPADRFESCYLGQLLGKMRQLVFSAFGLPVLSTSSLSVTPLLDLPTYPMF